MATSQSSSSPTPTPTPTLTTHSPIVSLSANSAATSQTQNHPQNPSSSGLKDLAVSLDKTHRALSDLSAGPFMTTLQALDQTSFNLQSTSRLLSDSEQNLNRSQANIEALVTKIKNAKDFLPSADD
ncbi:hypothetical protein BGX26_010175 [Mortierella sp. AD094]|nr:hypothetical protein BGX26_010175 [Mortierella sp. AD094]